MSAPVHLLERPNVVSTPPAAAPKAPKPARWPWVISLVLVAGVSAAIYWMRARVAGAPVSAGLRTVRVQIGDIEKTLRLTGVTAAENHSVLLAPRLTGHRRGGSQDHRMFLLDIVGPGTRVRNGDIVAQFDPLYMRNRLDDNRAAVVERGAEVRRMKAELAIKRAAHEQKIRTAKANLDKARLDLKTAPVRSAIQTELFRLRLEEAEAEYNQLLKERPYFNISENAEIRRVELDLREEEVETRRAEANVKTMTVRATMDGMVSMMNIRRGGDWGEVRAGDQIHRGYPYAEIVDLSSMIVDADVNQVDLHRLRIGAPARVRVDAFPGLVLPAKLYSIGSIAEGSRYRPEYVKQVPVRFDLLKSDSRLVPNYSVSVDVVLRKAEDVPIIPRECVFFEKDTGGAVAFVKTPGGWQERELVLGLANHTSVAVLSGLEEGDVIAADRPAPEPGYSVASST